MHYFIPGAILRRSINDVVLCDMSIVRQGEVSIMMGKVYECNVRGHQPYCFRKIFERLIETTYAQELLLITV